MKSLRRTGRATLSARIAQVLQRAVEELFFGEDGRAAAPASFERLRKGRGIEGIAKNAARRRSGLQFGENVDWHRGRSAAGKSRTGGAACTPYFQGGFRQDALAVLDPGAA